MKLNFPRRVRATSLIEVYGDIRSIVCAGYIDPKCEVGPLPMERPNKIMSECLIPMLVVKYSYTISASSLI
jgi:hypothetical protein